MNPFDHCMRVKQCS